MLNNPSQGEEERRGQKPVNNLLSGNIDLNKIHESSFFSEEQGDLQNKLQKAFIAYGIEDSKDALKHIINSYEVMAKALIENEVIDEEIRNSIEKTYTLNKIIVEVTSLSAI